MVKNAKDIKILALDVDGVLTDGSITFTESGEECKSFDAKDGQGIVCLQKAGFVTAIITARKNLTVEHRAKNLGIVELHQGAKYKLPVLESIVEKYNLSLKNVAYVGDDLPDICILEKVGLACCPNDAVKEVKKVCDFKSKYNGGRGAVRDVCDYILKSQKISSLELLKQAQLDSLKQG